MMVGFQELTNIIHGTLFNQPVELRIESNIFYCCLDYPMIMVLRPYTRG